MLTAENPSMDEPLHEKTVKEQCELNGVIVNSR